MSSISDLKSILKSWDDSKDSKTKLDLWISQRPANSSDNDGREYKPYPDVRETTFALDISNKYEFAKSMYPSPTTVDTTTTCKDMKFKRTLNQNFVKNFLSPATPYNSMLLFHGVGVGKCFAKGTRILLYNGKWKNVENITMDDVVMGDNSLPRNVTSVVTGKGKMFHIIPENAKSFTVNEDHILCLKKKITHGQFETVDMSVKEFLELNDFEQREYYCYRPPIIYFQNRSVQERASSVANIIDTCGNLSYNGKYIELFYEPVLHQSVLSLGIGCKMYGNKMCLYGAGLKILNLKNIRLNNNIINRHTYMKFKVVLDKTCGEYFGFAVDENHRFIIDDYIVTHNSSSAISIAEQFHGHFTKPTLVLMPPNLKDNFRKQIFDIDNPDKSATGTKYFNQDQLRGFDKSKIESNIRKLINEKYEIKGFQEFGNYVTKLSENESKRNHMIKKIFSNRVIIIDEIHNMRDNEESKKVPPVLMNILKHAENVKLVLMSATPMYNEAQEIIDVINFMRINDKKPKLKMSKVFDKDGFATDGLENLTNAVRGYISYMRGENPFSFPLRLYPDDAVMQYGVGVIQCKMSKLQRATYKMLMNKSSVVEDDDELSAHEGNRHFNLELQASNIVYPNNTIGKKGFFEIFDEVASSPFKVRYKDGATECLSKDHLQKYSAKMDYIVDKIMKSKGIVFVYSFYLHAGILPLAIALEQRGCRKYNSDNILQGGSVGKDVGNVYTIISPNKAYTANIDHEMSVIKSQDNKDGEKIKIVLASSIATEGFDFKNIREVYILEPWWNFSRTEQIIGRAVRHCSHIALPEEKRNVTIYNMVSVGVENSIDGRMLAEAAKKKSMIDKVEDVLKENAVDCVLNNKVMFYDPKEINKKILIETSQGSTKEMFIGDNPGSKFKKTKCNVPSNSSSVILDKSTYDQIFYMDELDNVIERIKSMYNTDRIMFTYNEIEQFVKSDILPYALNHMLDERVKVKNDTGYIIYRGEHYIFQPNDIDDLTVSIASRKKHKKTTKLMLKVPEHKEEAVSEEQSIVNKIQSELVALEERIGSKLANKFDSHIKLDYVIDRLKVEEMFKLLQESNVTEQMKLSLREAKILLKNDEFMRDILTNRIFRFDKETKQYSDATPLDLQKIGTIDLVPTKSLTGFMEYKKTKQGTLNIAFKMVDQNKSNSSGTICYKTSTIKQEDLIEKINMNGLSKLSKQALCDVYELVLRKDKKQFSRATK